MAGVVHRLVHRYVGREHGGHRGIAASLALPRELETLVQRRSDLAGEDLGAPVGPYLAGYPLPDGRYALARTLYLTEADCLGAVRTETLLVDPEDQARLEDPLVLAEAFDLRPDLRVELGEFQRTHEVAPLAPAALAPGHAAARELLAPLAALDPGILERVVAGHLGARPLALIGAPTTGPAPEVLLRALLHLAPRGAAWRAAWCALALSPRPWATLQLVPAPAADRFAIRAAREADVATVDLARGDVRNVEPSPLSHRLVEAVLRGDWDGLLGLCARAGQVGLRAPADLGAQVRFEELAAAPRRTPEEQVELANLLHARGAPPREVAEPFRQLLRDPPEGRLVWVMNVVASGWLGYRRAHPDEAPPEAEATLALLRRALAAQRFDLARAFLERLGGLDPAVRAAVEDEALAFAAGEAPLHGDPASPTAQALVALLVDRGGRDAAGAAAAARALAHRAPLAGPEPLGRLAARLVGPGRAPDADALGAARLEAALALVDAAAAAQAWPLAGEVVLALQAEAAGDPRAGDEAALAEAYARVAAMPEGPSAGLVHALVERHPLDRARPLERLLRALRHRPAPGAAPALEAALDVLVRRTTPAAPAGARRALLRAAVVARRAGVAGAPARARAHLVDLAVRRGEVASVVRAAAGHVRAGAWGRAAADLALALEARPPSLEAVPPRGTGRHGAADAGDGDSAQHPTGALSPGALADPADPERTGVLDARALDDRRLTGEVATCDLGDLDGDATGRHGRVNLDPAAADPPGVTAPGPAVDLRQAWRDLLAAGALAPCAPADAEAARGVLGRAPADAWDLPLEALARLAPRAAGVEAHGAALAVAARAWAASAAPLPDDPARGAMAVAAARALAAPEAPAAPGVPAAPGGAAWLARAAEVARGLPPGAVAEREALARAAAGRVGPADVVAAAALLDLLGRPAVLARAVAEAALRGPNGRGPGGPELDALWRALAALDPAALAADGPLLEALARRVREGRLSLEALAGLGPAALDQVLARAFEGPPSVGLQQATRALLFGLAEGQGAGRHELIRVGLQRLFPQVAPDRAFRGEVARGLRQRLPGVAAGDALGRALASFER